MTEDPKKSLDEVVYEDGRYPLEAFAFLHEGLARAVKDAYGERAEPPGPHHVSGEQLCLAMRDEALERWGMLAQTVLQRWNIRSTLDFGQMVYLLVVNGLMQKTEQDTVEDFRDVFDFREAFAPGQVFKDET